MEPDLVNEYIPGDEQYPQGIATLNETLVIPPIQKQENPFMRAAKTIGERAAKNYVMKKMGLEGIAGNVLGSILTGGVMGMNPASYMIGTALPNQIQGIAAYLRNKRAEKEYRRSENMLESRILSNIMSKQAAETAAASGPGGGRDVAMGGGSIPTKTSPPKSSGATSNPYSGGVGGVHSGYK